MERPRRPTFLGPAALAALIVGLVAIALGVSLLPTVSPEIYAQFPTWFTIVFDSGISAGAIVAVLLNLLLNSPRVQARDGGTDRDVSAHDAVRGPAAPAAREG